MSREQLEELHDHKNSDVNPDVEIPKLDMKKLKAHQAK